VTTLFAVERLRMLMAPEATNPLEVEGVLNPAGARGLDGHYYLFPRRAAAATTRRRSRLLIQANMVRMSQVFASCLVGLRRSLASMRCEETSEMAAETTTLRQLLDAGQSPWLDNISRVMLRDGAFQALLDRGIVGMTSNPSIFQKAIGGSDAYDDELRRLVRGHFATIALTHVCSGQ